VTVEPITHSSRLHRRKAYDAAYARRRKVDPDLASVEAMRSTGQWRRLVQHKRAIDPLCEECLKHGRTTPVEQVHHIRPAALRPDLFFVLSNLMSVCVPCHARFSAMERRSG